MSRREQVGNMPITQGQGTVPELDREMLDLEEAETCEVLEASLTRLVPY